MKAKKKQIESVLVQSNQVLSKGQVTIPDKRQFFLCILTLGWTFLIKIIDTSYGF